MKGKTEEAKNILLPCVKEEEANEEIQNVETVLSNNQGELKMFFQNLLNLL